MKKQNNTKSSRSDSSKYKGSIDHTIGMEEASRELKVPIGSILEYAIRGAIDIHYIADDGYFSLTVACLNKFIVDITRTIEMPIGDINRLCKIREAVKKPWHAPSNSEFVISKDSLRIFKKDFLALKKRLKAENNKEDKKVIAKKSAKNNFDDVKLMMDVSWKGNYSNSLYEVSLKCDNLFDNEFKLGPRFMPAMFLLVEEADKGTSFVSNAKLKKAYRLPDEAKKEIIKAFTNSIGARGKQIVKIERGVGKKLMIPKKNIKLNVKKSHMKPPL